MGKSANIQSPEVLDLFRQSLLKYADLTTQIISAEQMRIQSLRMWLQHDRQILLKQEIRKSEEFYNAAMNSMKNARRRGDSGHEEAKTVNVAKGRMEKLQRTGMQIKKWRSFLESKIEEHFIPAKRLNEFIQDNIPKAAARLNRMITSLEKYMLTQNTSIENSDTPKKEKVDEEKE